MLWDGMRLHGASQGGSVGHDEGQCAALQGENTGHDEGQCATLQGGNMGHDGRQRTTLQSNGSQWLRVARGAQRSVDFA